MKFVTSLSVDRLHAASTPLWPDGVNRLVVVVSHPDPVRDILVAYGVDPNHDRGHGRVVFEAVLPRAQLSAFITAVIDGDKVVIERRTPTTGMTNRPEYADAGAQDYPWTDEAVICYREPVDPDLKVARALAAAIRSDEALAEAVARQYPARGDGKDC